ncbi:MAG TPA: Spy/CpxP family protein refolding chaperone [Thermoanaerobaculia bacterium]|jgi:Spy/CpxP family protein refolding chaperone|nr:Spy/CpxP family protein refolding chaperone [Thermoanaerobaculia bacterium]
MKKFVIALLVTATSAIGFAQTAAPGTSRHQAHRAGFGRMAANLNLTDVQKQQLKDIRTADHQRNQQLYADFRAKLQEFRALKQANDPKADDVKAELRTMRPQMEAARTASREAMLNILTPEQRDQLKATRQHGFGRRMAGRGIRAGFGNLNLNDDQKAQLKQLRETTQQQNEQLFADVRATRQEFRSLNGSNDARATELKAHLESLRPQLEAVRKQQHEAFVTILTPEQRTQLEQWKAGRQSRRQSR